MALPNQKGYEGLCKELRKFMKTSLTGTQGYDHWNAAYGCSIKRSKGVYNFLKQKIRTEFAARKALQNYYTELRKGHQGHGYQIRFYKTTQGHDSEGQKVINFSILTAKVNSKQK